MATRTVPAALQTTLDSASAQLATLVKIKRTDSVIQGFTDSGEDLVYDDGDGDGAITYKAATAYTRRQLTEQADMGTGADEISGIIDSDDLNEDNIRAGLYDDAEITMLLVDFTDLTSGRDVVLEHGHIGQITLNDYGYEIELRPLKQRYSQVLGRLITVQDSARLGDAYNGINTTGAVWQPDTAYAVRAAGDANVGDVIKPADSEQTGFFYKCTVAGTSGSESNQPIWPTTLGATVTDNTVTWQAIKPLSQVGTVISVTDRLSFTAQGINVEADWWTEGRIEWLTGRNATANVNSDCKTDNGSGVLTMKLPVPFDISADSAEEDTFRIHAGYDLSQAQARDKFDNILNFQGFGIFTPGKDVQFQGPRGR